MMYWFDHWLNWLINVKVPMWEAEATPGRLPQEQWNVLHAETNTFVRDALKASPFQFITSCPSNAAETII